MLASPTGCTGHEKIVSFPNQKPPVFILLHLPEQPPQDRIIVNLIYPMTNEVFTRVATQLADQGFQVVSSDFTRPWGGFFVIEEQQTSKFIETYFPGLSPESLLQGARLSPKILVVGPNKRLSWQYHHRRAEVWRVVDGPVAVAKSDTDEQNDPETYQNGQLITLKQGERHRLIGLDTWGIVAEIWQHTNPDHPSDEADIIRVQDDFSR